MARRAALAHTRRTRGHTQETLAQRLGVDVSSVARWERGAATPSPGVREALARELALSLDQLAHIVPANEASGCTGTSTRSVPAGPTSTDETPELIKDRWTPAERDELTSRLAAEPAPVLTGEHAVRIAHQWRITPPPPAVAETRDGSERNRRIGASTLERLHARLRYLHHADDLVAGGDLHTTIRQELATTASLLHTTSYNEATGRALLLTLAELCQLAGWSTADAGHPTFAEHYYLNGIQAAHAADDPVLAAQLVSSLGYHLAELGNAPRDAVLVTRSALARLDGLACSQHSATPAVRALLYARVARAHVAADELGHAAEAIQRAQDEYARRSNTDPDPAWVYWLTPEEMDIIIGRMDTPLGRPEQGKQRLHTALHHCDPRRIRETTLYTTWLAQAHLRSRDTDHASTLAARARRLSETIPSAYSSHAVSQLTRELAGFATNQS